MLRENSIEENSIEYKKENIKRKKPTVEEIENYIQEKELNVDAKVFYDYFETGDWKDSNGNPVKNWKQKLLTWDKYSAREKERPNIKYSGDSLDIDFNEFYTFYGGKDETSNN